MKIPVYESNSRLGAMPSVRQSNAGATPDSFGAIEGQAVSRLGQELAQIGGEMRQRQDKIAAKEAFVMASDKLREYLHDPETGAFAKQGVNARGLLDSSDSTLEQIRNESAKNLSPMQREIFESFWVSQRESALTSLARHEANQMTDYENKTDAAIVTGAETDMVTNRYDPKAMAASRDIADTTVRSTGKRLGWSPEIMDKELKASRTRSYGAVIARFLAEDKPEEAKAILDKHSDDIIGPVRDDLDAKIKVQSVKVKVQGIVDTLAPLGMDPAGEIEAQQKLQTMLKNGDVTQTEYAAAEQSLSNRFADLDRFKNRANKAELEGVMKQIDGAANLTQAEEMAATVSNPAGQVDAVNFARWKFKDEYEARETRKSISRQIQGQAAMEAFRSKKTSAEFTTLQNLYDAIPTDAKAGPAQLDAYISTNFSGEQEEDLRRYASARIAGATPPASARAAEGKISDVGSTMINTRTAELTRMHIDLKQQANEPLTEQEVINYALSVTPPEQRQYLDKPALKTIVDYFQNKGREQFVPITMVSNALSSLRRTDLGSNPAESTQAMVDKYPGLYELVVAEIGPLNRPATAKEVQAATAKIVANETSGTGTWKGALVGALVIGGASVAGGVAGGPGGRPKREQFLVVYFQLLLAPGFHCI